MNKTHTQGQITLLTSGAWVIGEEQRADMEESSSKNKTESKNRGNKPTPTSKTVSKPHKPFKEMTSEEHKAYMSETGGVI